MRKLTDSFLKIPPPPHLPFKGTVPPDFSPLFFFFKQLLLAPIGKPSDDFDFFRIFAEIFDFSGASPVSLTPVKQKANNFIIVG